VKRNKKGKQIEDDGVALVACAALGAVFEDEQVLASALCGGHIVASAGLCGTDVGEFLIIEPTKLLDDRFVRGFRKRWSVPAKDANVREDRRGWLKKQLCCSVEVAWDGVCEVHAGDDPGPLIVVKHTALCRNG